MVVEQQSQRWQTSEPNAIQQASPEFMDALGVAVYTTDASGIITSFNEAAVELWGRRPELGKDMWCGSWKLYRLDGSPMSHDECPMGVALKEDRPVRGEEAIAERPDGTRVWFAPYPTPLHDADGHLVGAVNVLVDVTVKRHAELALRETEERLLAEVNVMRRMHEASTESSTEAVYDRILDAAVAIMHSDFASMQMFVPDRGIAGELLLLGHRGFDPESARFWEWVSPASATTCGIALETGQRCIVADVEQSDFMAGSDDLATFRQCGIRSCQTTPLVSRSGTLLGMISTHWREPHVPEESELLAIDVLARQAADLIERARAESALREALAVKDEFIGLVSHELRTPLTTILGNAAILARADSALDDESRLSAMGDVHQNAIRLSNTIEDLLLLAKLDQASIEREPVALARLVERLIHDHGQRPTRTIELTTDDCAPIVAGDERLIGHVFRNYVSNAVKYSPPDATIDVVVDTVDGQGRVRVFDRGIGIDPAEADRLFDSFYRADEVRRIEGMGIGLSVCRRLIEAVGGTCWAAPREGGGSEFGFSLPLDQSAVSDAAS